MLSENDTLLLLYMAGTKKGVWDALCFKDGGEGGSLNSYNNNLKQIVMNMIFSIYQPTYQKGVGLVGTFETIPFYVGAISAEQLWCMHNT